MRKLVFWYLPASAALVATAIFGSGLSAFLRGDTGTPVDQSSLRSPLQQAKKAGGVILPLILGDSLAKGTGDETGLGIGGHLTEELSIRHLPSRPVVNVAVNGARTADLWNQLASRNIQTLVAQSNVIIVSIGGNDLWGGNDWRNAPPRDPDAVMGQVLGKMDDIWVLLRKANPKGRIFIIGLYNPFTSTPFGNALNALVARWNGRLLEHFGKDPNLTVVPTSDIFSHHDRLSADRFHPGGEGYKLIARRIADGF